jgi:transposase InsO family protein
MKDTRKVKKLEAENRRLKTALAEATLAKDALETLVEVVNEHYRADVKNEFRTEAIQRTGESSKHTVSSLCDYFQYTRSAYYKSLNDRCATALAESVVIEMVQQERHLQPRLGGKKLYYLLADDIHRMSPHFGRDKFFDLSGRHDLLVKRKRAYQKTTNSYHHFHKYGNLLKDKVLSGQNQAWASDITYIRVGTGKQFVYLSLITDMYSRKIAGWNLSESLSIEGSIIALKMALKENPAHKSLIHHSDRGVQYCSHDYAQLLQKNKVSISMTEENHCYENGLAERVNGILKDEYGLDGTFKDIAHARRSCRQAIDMYNTRRPHLSLKFKTPQQVHHAA